MTLAEDRYAVIGNPIAHSKSPEIHAAFARETGERIRYERIFAPLDDFRGTLREFATAGGRGCNVTLPFKEQAFALADARSDRAEAAGACNTLAWRDGGLYGDNTDGVGLCRDLVHNLGWTLQGSRILVLGAGGAARGIVLPLASSGAARVTIANRTREKADALAAAFGGTATPVDAQGFDALPGRDFDFVVNATSAGHDTSFDARSAWPTLRANANLRAYDVGYGAAARPFMQWAREQGASAVADGLGMLVEQAAESFFVWRGVRPETRHVLASLRG